MRICMLLHKSVEHDSRVRREARALTAAGHDVTVVHLPRERHADERELDGFRVVCATPRAGARRALPFNAYRLGFLVGFVRRAVRARPDAVHAHDAPMLAPALLAARLAGAKLVYDSHELATGVPYRERFWARMVAGLERIALPRCAAVITVSDGIADRLRELYGLRERPMVLRNVPDLDTAAEGTAGLRERLEIGSAPLVLHQGALAPRRGCETLVAAVARLPGAHLVFLGDAWPGYDGVVERFARDSGAGGRVHFLPSVPVRELLRHTREADVGVSLLSDDCENHRLALPNKVFEYIAARVPVVVSDLPELRALVEEHGVGWTADASDPADLARAVSAALAEGGARSEALSGAAGALRWSREAQVLLRLYERLDRRAGESRALIFVRNGVSQDSRVLRSARLLEQLGHRVTVVGVVTRIAPERSARIGQVDVRRLSPGFRTRFALQRARTGSQASDAPPPPTATSTPGARPSGLRQRLYRLMVTADWYLRAGAVVRRERPRLVHCNDWNTMWIGVASKLLGARVVYDAHELWPDRNLRPEARWWLLLWEAVFVRVADRVITTSPGYAAVMARRYRIQPPDVVRNIPEYSSRPPARARLGGRPVAVYWGAVTPGRGLEPVIRALALSDDFDLRIVGPDAWGYRMHLEALAARLGVTERVELSAPRGPEEAADVLQGAAIGLALIEPACLSYELTLPNKLFEYLLAGVPILASDVPVLAGFVESHRIGMVVRPTPEEVSAGVLAMLDHARRESMASAIERAQATLDWERESRGLVAAYAAATRPGRNGAR